MCNALWTINRDSARVNWKLEELFLKSWRTKPIYTLAYYPFLGIRDFEDRTHFSKPLDSTIRRSFLDVCIISSSLSYPLYSDGRKSNWVIERELAKLAAVQVESLGKPEVTIYKSLDSL